MYRVLLYLAIVELIYCVDFSSFCTSDFIALNNYSAEEHRVVTGDGYILKMFRISNSPQMRNSENQQTKPVVFFMHGMADSSDGYVISSPENGLSYVMADSGYDVWLGNARGNRYSREHIKLKPSSKAFWHFDWQEIGSIDVPTMINYVLKKTSQVALHYVGHSQGTTSFLVMLSLRPQFNQKIKTSHLMAPVAFCRHMPSPLARYGGTVINLLPDSEFLYHNKKFSSWILWVCSFPLIRFFCNDIMENIVGGQSPQSNETLLSIILATHPAGISTRQLKHYYQLSQTDRFQFYDFGKKKNLVKYRRSVPPDFPLINVNPATPIHLYYSDYDIMVSVSDVLTLARNLHQCTLHHIDYRDWNHMDFLFGKSVKQVINNVILNITNDYEMQKKKGESK